MEGKKKKATHCIVVCDTYDHEDYPVYVEKGQDPREVAKEFDGKNMQRIMECYALNQDIDMQLGELRAYHWD